MYKRKRFYRRKRNYLKKRTFRRRGAFNRRKLRGKRLTVRKQSVIAPDVSIVKLKYTTTVLKWSSPLSTAGQTANYCIRANSVYDPDAALGGNQPTGFDQMMALYDKYHVIGSSIKLEMANQNAYPCVVALWPSQTQWTSVIPPVGYNVDEQKYGQVDILPTNGQTPKTMKSYMNTNKIFGLSDTANDPDYWGDASNNPTKQWYWNVYCDSGNQNVAPAVTLQLKVTYYVKFFQQKKELDYS